MTKLMVAFSKFSKAAKIGGGRQDSIPVEAFFLPPQASELPPPIKNPRNLISF